MSDRFNVYIQVLDIGYEIPRRYRRNPSSTSQMLLTAYRISRGELFHKLAGCGMQHELLTWITNFLDDRTQRVVMNGQLLKFVQVQSVHRKRSFPEPFLFVLYNNDVIDHVGVGAASVTTLFADDMKHTPE